MAMGYADAGGGPPPRHEHGAAAPSDQRPTRGVDTLTADPATPADVSLTLVARAQSATLASGRVIDGLHPQRHDSRARPSGPQAGQLVQVRVVNESVADGLTLHWHGVDVPNADGRRRRRHPGRRRRRRRVTSTGSSPPTRAPTGTTRTRCPTSRCGGGCSGRSSSSPARHRPAAARTLTLSPRSTHLRRAPHGQRPRRRRRRCRGRPVSTVRVRVVNTDNGPLRVWVGGAPFRCSRSTATTVNGPAPVAGLARVTGHSRGREPTSRSSRPATARPVRVRARRARRRWSSAPDQAEPRRPAPRSPEHVVDLLHLRGPGRRSASIRAHRDRRFDYAIGRRPGFLDGRPGLWWTINGHLFPDVPMFVVAAGRRGAHARSATQAARSTRCTCTATMPWC